jgi:hypothetical protein
MKLKSMTAHLASVAMAFALFGSIGVHEASAASQNITLSVSNVYTTGWKLNLSWTAVSGATTYKVQYAKKPDVQSSSLVLTTTSSTSLSHTMDTSLGYRFFRIYAYNSSGTLLGYSNLVGTAKYPSGLVVKMKQDSALTNSYPDPAGSSNPAIYQKPLWFTQIDANVRAQYVAPNFQMGEFIKDTTLTSAVVDPVMVQHVQNARNRYGVMTLSSGYRTPAYNSSIGGATYSRHMYGDAVDVPAATYSVFDALRTAFAPENPSYVEPYDQASNNHYHGDWRNETTTRGYQNFL